MTASIVPKAAERMRDVIVAAVAQETGVPAEDIMRTRLRSPRAVNARRAAMWVVREVLEQSDMPDDFEVADVFGVQMRTVEQACSGIWDTPELSHVAQRVLHEYLAQRSRRRTSQRADDLAQTSRTSNGRKGGGCDDLAQG
jgi:chromosomal replication initiation ATPase DnaA